MSYANQWSVDCPICGQELTNDFSDDTRVPYYECHRCEDDMGTLDSSFWKVDFDQYGDPIAWPSTQAKFKNAWEAEREKGREMAHRQSERAKMTDPYQGERSTSINWIDVEPVAFEGRGRKPDSEPIIRFTYTNKTRAGIRTGLVGTLNSKASSLWGPPSSFRLRFVKKNEREARARIERSSDPLLAKMGGQGKNKDGTIRYMKFGCTNFGRVTGIKPGYCRIEVMQDGAFEFDFEIEEGFNNRED